MTKLEIVNNIVNQTGIDKTQVASVVDAFMSTIKDSMCNNENVYLRGFGSFIIVKRKKKIGRNISKNTPVVIPEHFIPKFKPCDEFVEDVKNKRTV